MKKKILWILPICLFTCGCFTNNKKLTCTIEETYDDIKTETTIVTKFKKGKAVSSSGKVIMYFDRAEDAQSYLDAFDATEEEKENIKVEGNNLIITSEEEFSEDEGAKTRNEVLIYFENSGYTCK